MTLIIIKAHSEAFLQQIILDAENRRVQALMNALDGKNANPPREDKTTCHQELACRVAMATVL